MLLEEIAAEILIKYKKFPHKEGALAALKSEFNSHFPRSQYDRWAKTEIPESLSQNIVATVGKNRDVSIRFIIKDLDIISKTI